MFAINEIFNEVLPLIRQFSPTIGAIIGGPVGFSVGYILPLLASAFDAKPHDLKQLVTNIMNDPNAKDKLQKIEVEQSDYLNSILQSVNKLESAEINLKLTWAKNT